VGITDSSQARIRHKRNSSKVGYFVHTVREEKNMLKNLILSEKTKGTITIVATLAKASS
jgi:hypothetical protein